MNTDIGVSAGIGSPEATVGANRPGSRRVDLSAIPWNVPWALLDEHEAAAVLRQSVKVLRRQRHEGCGPKFLKINGCTVRYRVSDLQAFLADQPTGGGVQPGATERRGPGRPRKVNA
jgi:hypothetical protein